MINEREVICSFGKLEYIGVCFDNSGEQYAMIRNGDNITQKKLYETENKGYYFIYDNKRYYMSDGKPINTKAIEKNGKVITYINGVPHDWNEMIKINFKREVKESFKEEHPKNKNECLSIIKSIIREKMYFWDGCYINNEEMYYYNQLIANENKLLEVYTEISKEKYKEKKEEIRERAKEFQASFNDHDYSYSELLERQAYFEKMGKRFGLLKEFRENAII